MIGRVGWLKIGVGLAFGAIGVRLFQVQILQHDDYVARASAEHVKKFVLPAKRGEIFMMDGGRVVPVVMNVRVYTVFVDPKMVKEDKKVEEVITKVVPEEKRVGSFEEAWKDRNNQYYVVGRELTLEQAEKIKAEALVGVGFTETVRREYPWGGLAGQILGFVNGEGKGQYGVEGAFDAELSGEDGQLVTVTDVNSVPLTIGENNVKEPAVNGKNVVLTIDQGIQREAEKALARGLERSGGTYASALVMNPNNGQILAMANLPTYDPGEYRKVEDASVYQNATLAAVYEPASVCKTFAFAAGVDKGLIKPSDTYNNEGVTVVDGWPIKNVNQGHRGEITFQEAMNFSLNTGTVEALRRFDAGANDITRKSRDILYEYYHDKFGLGEYTGVELYEEKGSVISPEDAEGSAIRYANMTFGQGLAVTMLQIASSYSAIVNGGDYYKPTIMAGEMVDGEFRAAEKAESTRKVVSEQTSATMREMLETGRSQLTLAKQDPSGYRLGAKSGSAEVADPSGKGYKKNEAIATYVGYGGKELPEYLIIARIGGEGKSMEGAVDAGPIWTEISNFLVRYMGV